MPWLKITSFSLELSVIVQLLTHAPPFFKFEKFPKSGDLPLSKSKYWASPSYWKHLRTPFPPAPNHQPPNSTKWAPYPLYSEKLRPPPTPSPRSRNIETTNVLVVFWLPRPQELQGVQGLERPGTDIVGVICSVGFGVSCSYRLSWREGLLMALWFGCEPLSVLELVLWAV